MSGDGQLWCWGWNAYGQCGRAAISRQPAVVDALKGLHCEQVAAGMAHTVTCTRDGACYAFGWNADGQLGSGDTVSRAEPSLVESQQLDHEHVVQVSEC